MAFVSSDKFFPGDPDFEWVHQKVHRALTAPPRHDPDRPGPAPTPTDSGRPSVPPSPSASPSQSSDPGEAVEVADSCAYHPDGADAG